MRIVIAVLLACAWCAHAGIDPARSVLCAVGAAVFGAMWQARAKERG